MTARFPEAPAVLVTGDVVHKRLRPHLHALRYRVFSLLIDLDRIDAAAAACRLFRHDRLAPLALFDRDHLTPHPDGIAVAARAMFRDHGFETEGRRVYLLAYPRVFGFAFNPISVFYLVTSGDDVEAVIYEVRNTFGERKCYVTAAGPPRDGILAHGFAKELFVSPFAPGTGRYDFRLRIDAERPLVAITFRDAQGPLIKTHFSGVSTALTTVAAAKALVRIPFMTAKVVAGIHWEALKLWVKGVPLSPRHRSPRFSISKAEAHPLKGDHVRS